VGIVAWIVWGLFVGLIARFMLPGRHRIGIVLTIVLGVAGSVLGGLLATLIGIGDADDFDFVSFLIAVGTSVLLLAVVGRVSRALPDRQRRDELPGER
jgi:uncharacterized membrane protein YeaQ/YmgE (transglycosylase-associated protein family)